MNDKEDKDSSTLASCLAILIFCGLIFILFFKNLDIPDPSVTAKYTEQTAQAIIDGSWRIAWAILVVALAKISS
mgnify:CR=1 FL=1